MFTRMTAFGSTEKYSRGRRGAPAKGVGWFPRRESSNLSFSVKLKTTEKSSFLFHMREI